MNLLFMSVAIAIVVSGVVWLFFKFAMWTYTLEDKDIKGNTMRIIQSPSPNFSTSVHTKFGVQIHKTLGLMPGTVEWLRNPASQASANVLFAKNGDIHELVDLENRAWTSGRISNPSQRALKIMLKTMQGEWIKPGYYLVQCEVECLAHETFTEEQYEAIVWYFKNKLEFEVTSKNFLTHQDTASDKPELENERAEILRKLNVPKEIDTPEKPKEEIVPKKIVLELKVMGLRLKLIQLLIKLFRLKR